MPAYNTEKFIWKAIESVIDQSTQNWELLIVDDCSTDNTAEIVMSYLHDQRIRFQRSPKNEGHTKSLNKCLDMAAGMYFTLQDSDDFALPTKFEEQVSVLSTGKYGLCSTYGYSIDENGKKISNWYTDEAQRKPKNEIIAKLPEDCWILGPSMMFTSAVRQKIGYFDPECYFGNDLNYWVRAMKYFEWTRIEKELYVKRRNKTGARTVPKAHERNWHKYSFERAEECPKIRYI